MECRSCIWCSGHRGLDRCYHADLIHIEGDEWASYLVAPRVEEGFFCSRYTEREEDNG